MYIIVHNICYYLLYMYTGLGRGEEGTDAELGGGEEEGGGDEEGY